jgi:hypothetical protein
MLRSLLLLSCMLAVASAADFTGTWKLNTGQSKYTGIPAPKELTVTYKPNGTGFDYMAKGISADGQAISSSFTYVKDGQEIKTTGFPNWDTIVIKGGMSGKSVAQMKRGGKMIGSVTRTLSADEKKMTLSGKITTPDGKPATYYSVYDKQ